MKIIHVISGLEKGGGERVVVELANLAVQKGDDVSIVAGWPVTPAYLQNDIDSKINVQFIGKTKTLAYLKIFYWIIINKKWICNHDVLHCHLSFGAVFGSVADIILKKILFKKRPVIVETYHAVGMPIPKFNLLIHSRMMLQRDGIVFMLKDVYWDNFISKHPRLRSEIIPNGISRINTTENIKQQQQFRKELNLPDNCKYLVGTVSHLRTDRKPWLYVPIFQEIYKAIGSDVHFILIGDGVEYEKIKTLFEEAGLTACIHMPGFVNDPSIALPNMDIYVSVSVREAAGVSMVEAAMCNVPVVGIQFIENYEAKNDDWVWSHTDVKEVAKKIIFLLQNDEERNKLASRQNNYVNNHFTSEAMYFSYDSFYRKILADKPIT